ncbi:MAG: HpcH/HpaI aldolase/citrate lyase family protein [Bacteroidales bacterium]|nr:HpcH/HpaI aldolase/citrate lyase family protein [Bacteroidales bacterium]
MAEVNQMVVVGNRGKKVRSDCYVELQLTNDGGVAIELKSKVEVMFGKANRKLIRDIFDFFEINNAKVYVEEGGALPLVIAARVEAAIKLLLKSDKDYLLDMIDENKNQTDRSDHRISRLYLPGNKPSMMINAGIHQPNGIILDLEDAVAHDKKYETRFLVRNVLRGMNFYGAERMLRINQIPMGLDDLDFVVPHFVNLILIPKCESANQIQQVNERIDAIKKEKNIDYQIWLMPIVESALGVIKAYEIASASDNVVAMAIGLEDYTADLGTKRTDEGIESFYARSQVVNACRAARIQPIDSVFSDVSDMEALARNVQVSKSLGFDGMGCIHPRQIPVIHQNFAPSEAEILKAKRIVDAFIKATEKGLGVVSLGTKMIDPPVVKRAENTLNMAISLEMVPSNWHDTFEA